MAVYRHQTAGCTVIMGKMKIIDEPYGHLAFFFITCLFIWPCWVFIAACSIFCYGMDFSCGAGSVVVWQRLQSAWASVI